MAQQEKQLSTQVIELREEMGRAEQRLGEVRAEIEFKNFGPWPVKNDKICIIANP